MPEQKSNGNPYSDPKTIRGLFQGARVSDQQRQRHMQRLEKRFPPRTPVTDMTNQLREFAVIGLLLVGALVTLWIWNELLGVQESDPPPPPVAEEAATPTPETHPESTPTPEAEPEPAVTPTAVPTNEPDEAIAAQCTPGDVAQVLSDFVGAFNAGNFDRLRELLPDEPYEHAPTYPQPQGPQDVLWMFRHHPDDAITDPDEVIAYLEKRHAAGERWQLKEYQIDRDGNPMMEMPEIRVAHAVFQRRADDMESHLLEARLHVNCVEKLVVLWQSFSNDPAVARPIMVEDFLAAAEPLQYSQEFTLRLLITMDYRVDGGAPGEFDLRRFESVGPEQRERERVVVSSTDSRGAVRGVVYYVQDGYEWLLQQRGWDVIGELPDEPQLPLEIRIAQTEPEMTAELIRDRLDEIPADGSITLRSELQSLPAFLQNAVRVIESPIVEQTFEVDIVDGAVVRSRYRIVDETGNKVLTPEIRFIEFRRTSPNRLQFQIPQQHQAGDFQYQIPDQLPDEISFQSQQRHDDGMSENYRLRWNNVSLGLLVTPSRGGLDPSFNGDRSEWHPDQVELADYSAGTLMWMDPDDAGHPTHAMWDTGWYRFTLTVDAHELPPGAEWDVEILVAVVEALSQVPGAETP
jgi:hypothetical protein